MSSVRTRERMVAGLRERGIRDARVLAAMERIPRHQFVDEALAAHAYEDTALPIGWGQTLSRPWEVARMTEALLVCEPERVLEVGAGSGYQTAVLAELVSTVWAGELISRLASQARTILHRMGYTNAYLRPGDGREVWAHKGPFDAGLVAASTLEPPAEILEQIREGGCLVAPQFEEEGQRLIRWTREADNLRKEDLGPCQFVPLRREAEQ